MTATPTAMLYDVSFYIFSLLACPCSSIIVSYGSTTRDAVTRAYARAYSIAQLHCERCWGKNINKGPGDDDDVEKNEIKRARGNVGFALIRYLPN